MNKLPPGRTRTARRRINARGTQNLPNGGRRDRHAELCQLAMDPAVFPLGFSFARRTTRRAMPGTVGGRPGLRRLLMSYLLPASLRCQARSIASVTGRTSLQRLRGRSRASAANHTRSARLVPHPAGVPTQHHVLVPEHQQLSILRQVSAEHQDGQAEYPARQQVDDLEQHPASQLSLPPSCWPQRRSTTQSSIRVAHDGDTLPSWAPPGIRWGWPRGDARRRGRCSLRGCRRAHVRAGV